jgi:AraC family transcriptional regulator
MRIGPDQVIRINRAVNFINQNPGGDLSLKRLAALANYSPFHFQRLFASIVGETPKQYILRIRLESAAHAIVMFGDRSITEIALDSGFSSSATFSRAFRNYFRIAPKELKSIPHEERFRMYSEGKLGKYLFDTDRYFYQAGLHNQNFNMDAVRITYLDPAEGVFVSCSLDHEVLIEDVWKRVARIAEANDLIGPRTTFIGALHPHQKLYRAIATVEPDRSLPRTIDRIDIKGGKFAVVPAGGPVASSFAVTRAFANSWLPESGYRISDMFMLEFLESNPAQKSYQQIQRSVYIPVAAAS